MDEGCAAPNTYISAGGARTLVATSKDDRWFFLYGFEKSNRANISDAELETLQKVTAELLVRTAAQLEIALDDQSLEEICHDHQEGPY